jgi:hypothetical protein
MSRNRCLGSWILAISLTLGLGVVVAPSRDASGQQESKMLRHIVLFKFKDTSSQQDIDRVIDAFRALPSKIPEIAGFEFGKDNSPEGQANGFTHCFQVTFKTEKDRSVYLPHAAHQAFVEVLKPHLDKVLVIDYWAGK